MQNNGFKEPSFKCLRWFIYRINCVVYRTKSSLKDDETFAVFIKNRSHAIHLYHHQVVSHMKHTLPTSYFDTVSEAKKYDKKQQTTIYHLARELQLTLMEELYEQIKILKENQHES